MTSIFARPTTLPVFVDGQQCEAVVDGYHYLGSEWDGRRNKVHVQPWRKARVVDGVYYEERPVGQDYWIGAAHFERLLIEGSRPA